MYSSQTKTVLPASKNTNTIHTQSGRLEPKVLSPTSLFKAQNAMLGADVSELNRRSLDFSPTGPQVTFRRKRDKEAQLAGAILPTSPISGSLKRLNISSENQLITPNLNSSYDDEQQSYGSEIIKSPQDSAEASFTSPTWTGSPRFENNLSASSEYELTPTITSQTSSRTLTEVDSLLSEVKTKGKLTNLNSTNDNSFNSKNINLNSERNSVEHGLVMYQQFTDKVKSLNQSSNNIGSLPNRHSSDSTGKDSHIASTIAKPTLKSMEHEDETSYTENIYPTSLNQQHFNPTQGFRQHHNKAEIFFPDSGKRLTTASGNSQTSTSQSIANTDEVSKALHDKPESPFLNANLTSNKSLPAPKVDEKFSLSRNPMCSTIGVVLPETTHQLSPISIVNHDNNMLQSSNSSINSSLDGDRKESTDLDSIGNEDTTSMEQNSPLETMKPNSEVNSFFPDALSPNFINGSKRLEEVETPTSEESGIGTLKPLKRKITRSQPVTKRPATVAPSLEFMPEPVEKVVPVTLKAVDPKEYFTFNKLIGKGKFGRVYHCVDKRNGLQLAAKVIDIKRVGRHKDGNLTEVAVLQAIGSHESIASLHSAYEIGQECYIFTEYVSGGALYNRIEADDDINEEIASSIIRQIVLGLQHLQHCSVLHLDLKPENLMMVAPTGYLLKIIDFGLACFFDPMRPNKRIGGTYTYSAPETINYDCLHFGTDIWSVGVITYELLAGITPFEIPQSGDLDRELNMNEITTNVINCRYNFDDNGICDASDLAKDFIRSIFKKNPKDRPTTSECLEHAWIKSSECLPKVCRKVSLRRRHTAIGKYKTTLTRISQSNHVN